MQSLSLLVLILGIVFITVGYMDNKVKETKQEKIIEYRFVPRSIYDDKLNPLT